MSQVWLIATAAKRSFRRGSHRAAGRVAARRARRQHADETCGLHRRGFPMGRRRSLICRDPMPIQTIG